MVGNVYVVHLKRTTKQTDIRYISCSTGQAFIHAIRCLFETERNLTSNENTLVNFHGASADNSAHRQQTTASNTAFQVRLINLKFTEICKYIPCQLFSHFNRHESVSSRNSKFKFQIY